MSLVQTLSTTHSQTHCSQCGSDTSHTQSAEEAHRRIRELEAQIRLLNTKAAATADKLADYEDEIQTLRSKVQNPLPTTSVSPKRSSPTPDDDQRKASQNQKSLAPPPPPPPPGLSRLPSLSSFLPGRRNAATNPPSNQPTSDLRPSLLSKTQSANNISTHSLPSTTATSTTSTTTTNNHPSLDPPPPPTDSQPDHDQHQNLSSMLEAEKKARQAAESSLSQAHTELEELTAQLFGQANEMVATERKARVKLEERIALLEDRDGEKRQRLDKLEKAVGRIDRVRGMLG